MPIGLQELIHQLEEGQGVKYIKLTLILLGLVTLTAIYDLREFSNFTSSEAMDNAQLARNLAHGRGYTTRFIRPLSFALLQKVNGEKPGTLNQEQPDLANPPVYPVFLAGFMKILPFRYTVPSSFYRYQPELLIALINQSLFFLALFMVFRLARKLFDSPVAWLSTIIMAATDLFWRFSISGLPTMLLIVMLLGISTCLVLLDEKSRSEATREAWFITVAGLIGVLLGLGTLTRYSFGWFAFPVIAFIAAFAGKRRIVLSLIVFGLFVAIISPWIYRNYTLSETFFGVSGFSIHQETGPAGGFQGNHLERSLPRNLDVALNAVGLSDYCRKLLVNLKAMAQDDLPRFGGNWISAFFLVGLLVPFRSPGLNRFRLFLLLSLFVALIVQGLGKTHLSNDSPQVNSENLLVLFAPLAFIFGVALFFTVLDQIAMPFPPLRTLAITSFAVVLSAPLILHLLPPRSYPIAWPPYYPPRIQEFAGWMNDDELMMSDMPWAVAWYGDRKTIWITLDTGGTARSDFFAIYDYQKPIKGLYLTQITMDARFLSETIKGEEGAWGRFVFESLLRTNVPAGFPLRQAPNGLLPEQLFLSDRVRWTKPVK